MQALDALANFHAEAEQSLIGAVLLDPKSLDQIDGVASDDFASEGHRIIWKTISRMAAGGEAIDVITVAEKLQGRIDLAYLGELANAVVSTRNVASWAKIVRESAISRQLKDAAQEIFTTAGKSIPIAQKIEAAQSAVMGIGDQVSKKHPRIIADVLVDVIDEMQDRMHGRSEPETTGIRPIDELANLMVPGNFVIVAARPSMGKTAFALSIAEAVCSKGKTALFCSQEMGGVSIVQRLISSVGKIPLEKVINADLSGDLMDKVVVTSTKLNEQKLVIDEQAALSLSEIRTKARQTKRKHGLDLIVVDYLQLMVGESEIRHEEIAAISRGLKKLAMDMQVPVIALSQLNRGLESRADKRPLMADLRESGQIEQDADVILMLYRDEIYNESSHLRGIAEVICRKNRQGKPGMVHMAFVGQFCSFEPFYGVIPQPEKQDRPFKKGWK